MVEFVDQSPSFAHGFTCGKLWQRLHVEVDPIEVVVSGEVREMIVRMCGVTGWAAEFKELTPDWVQATLTRSKKPRLAVMPSA